MTSTSHRIQGDSAAILWDFGLTDKHSVLLCGVRVRVTDLQKPLRLYWISLMQSRGGYTGCRKPVAVLNVTGSGANTYLRYSSKPALTASSIL